MLIRTAALVGLALVACVPIPATPSPSISPISTGVVTATTAPTLTPTPSPSPTAPPIVVTAAGQIPAESAYVLAQNTGAERVLLLDLEAKKSREVVRFDRPQAANRAVVLSASTDGQTLAILEKSDGTTLLHIVKTARGEIRTLPQQEGVDGPNVSPDGRNIAVSWKSADTVLNGLWILPTDGSVGTRIIAQAPGPGSPPQPRAWSIDGRWLAAFGAGAAGQQILVLDTRAGATTFDPARGLTGGDGRVLAGIDAVFRGTEVFTWTSRGSAGVPTVSSYDIVTRATGTVYTAPDGINLIDVVPRPNSRAVAIRLAPFPIVAANSPNSIILVEPAATPRTLSALAAVLRLWWSADGARLYATTGGDDSVGQVVDIFGTWATMRYCLRGGDPPACV